MGLPVLLVHGWLSGPRTFGALPESLRAAGHRVLPVFQQYGSWPRGVTLDDLAAELDRALRGALAQLDAPPVIIGHSMGGLVARTWMLRHHAALGRPAPVARLIECASPRHGVFLARFGRGTISLGLVPGTTLARQMLAPNPFLWDLAWGEHEHAARLPPVISIAALLQRTTLLSVLAGGRESDGVVPLVCTNPNARFVRGAGVRTAEGETPARAFRLFQHFAHSGREGILPLRKAERYAPLERAFLAAVEGHALDTHGEAASAHARQTLLILRQPAGQPAPVLEVEGLDADPPRRLNAAATHAAGLTLFLLKAPQANQTLKWKLASTKISGSIAAGSVTYMDVQPA